MNTAIVDYTSAALCTPFTPFPPTGDAAIVSMQEEDRAMGMATCNKNLLNITRVVLRYPSGQTDTQTDRHMPNHHNNNFATAPTGEVNVRKV